MFQPPFCPHRHCDAHYHRPQTRWWEQRGSYLARLLGSRTRQALALQLLGLTVLSQ